MATIAEARERYDDARAMALEALEEYRSEGDHWSEALTLANLGNIACQVYAPAEAEDWYCRSLSALAELGDLAHAALVLRQLAAVAAYQEHYERAATLAGAAHALQEASGRPVPASHAQDFQDTLGTLRNVMPGSQFEVSWASGSAMDLDDAARYALRSSSRSTT